MLLSELKSGEKAIIAKVRGRGAFRRRIIEMGFIKGQEIKVIKNAPLRDPIEYRLMGYRVSLRRSEATLIEVEHANGNTDAQFVIDASVEKQPPSEPRYNGNQSKGKEVNIALVGNPNSGKTSIFNFASRSQEHVGNYGGVTVDSKTARFYINDYIINITDLPGTYSVSCYSPEEVCVRQHIIEEVPDVVINVVDASNLERNLYLTTQLIDMDIKVVVALNMFDEFEKNEDILNIGLLGNLLGIPIVPTVGAKGRGIRELFQKVVDVYNDEDPVQRHIHINYGEEIEASIGKIQSTLKIKENYPITDKISSRYLSLKLLEKDTHILKFVLKAPNYKDIMKLARQEYDRLLGIFHEDSATVITDYKYGFIAGALKETYKQGIKRRYKITEILDSFFTHKIFGFPIFLFFMWLMFWTTFTVGNYPMAWIENGIGLLGRFIGSSMAEGSLKALLIDGIIGGVGGVIVFLPNILILFLFISFMEDSGYMARTVFIMDKIMHKIGLHGKSFIPLIMGFGCNVPAIMATRTIEDRQNRLLTILINPFMSCSARLPVYLLLIGAIFPKNRGSILFMIYITGIIMGSAVALIFKKTLFKSKDTPFVMELPPYRLPTVRSTVKHMWGKGSQYIKKMGGVILVASVIMWALGYFPRDYKGIESMDRKITTAENGKKQAENIEELEKIDNRLAMLETQKESERLENSYIGQIGRTIEPVIRPLGFDWKMGVSLISGVAAKEIVVSTLGVLYQADATTENSTEHLTGRIQNAHYETGKRENMKVFTPLATLSFIAFILIYFPCVAVVAAIKKEAGHWKWAAFAVLYTTGLAYLVSLLIYQIGNVFI